MKNRQSSIIYMNNAATSWPKPECVLESVVESLSLPVFGSGRTSGNQGNDYPTLAREALSDFFNAGPPENFIFTQNATDSLNLLIAGFIKRADMPCHVITTALDHNSVLRPLYELESEGKIRLSVIPFEDGKVSVTDVSKAVCPDTKLMVMSHGSNVLGSVQDIGVIGDFLIKKGIYFIVDGAQTAGHIPVDLGILPVDAYVFTGHKGLFGIAGTGGFFIRDPERVSPVQTGGTGTDSFSLHHPLYMPERFEVGTSNYPGIAALLAGVGFLASVGVERIHEKGMRQTGYIINELKDDPNVVIYNKNPVLPVISFSITGLDDDDVGFILARGYGIICRTGLHCAPLVHDEIDGGEGCIRLSLSWFTTDEECRIVVGAIREIAKNANISFSQA